MPEIKSKFSAKQRVKYGDSTVVIIAKRLDPNETVWRYEIRNPQTNFQVWTTEDKLKGEVAL